MTESNVRVRYAPSPTGLLHVGNLRTGLFAWLFTRQQGGVFVLRIEDTDRTRSEPQFEDQIYRDLKWLGLDWDEGPDVGGRCGPYRQSERYELYRAQALGLIDDGSAYRCFCSEESLKRQAEESRRAGGSWKYAGTCRRLSADREREKIDAGEPWVVRLAVREGAVSFDDLVHGETSFPADVISDPILMRSNQTPTYNYAVVVDDALMEISHVIRGDDHLSNTPKQVLIYEAMGRPVPRFAHLSTVLGPDQAKLSKRHGAISAAEFREAGYLPEALMNYIALLGWSPGAEGSEIVPPERLVAEFRLEKVNKNPAVFDFGKLNFINRHYLRESPEAEALVRDRLSDAGCLPASAPDAAEWVSVVMDTLLQSVDVVGEIPRVLNEVVGFPLEGVSREVFVEDPGARELVGMLALELDGDGYLTLEAFRGIVSRLRDETGRKGRQLFHPLRVALTARESGPELDKLIPLVETGARLGVGGIRSCRDRVRAFLLHLDGASDGG